MNQQVFCMQSVDPGERWTGMAFLRVVKQRKSYLCTAATRVLDMHSRGFSYNVREAVKTPMDDRLTPNLVMESFRHRAVGHQRNDGGETLQFMGALRYYCEAEEIPLWVYPPAASMTVYQSPMSFIVTQLLEGKLLKDHGLSAWRLLMQKIMHDADYYWLMEIFRYSAHDIALTEWHPEAPHSGDHLSPLMTWYHVA